MGVWVGERKDKAMRTVACEKEKWKNSYYSHQEARSPGLTVKSDEWAAYKSLKKNGYNHLTANHSFSFVSEDGGTHSSSNQVEPGQKHPKIEARNDKKPSSWISCRLYFFMCDARHQQKILVDCFIELIQCNKFY